MPDGEQLLDTTAVAARVGLPVSTVRVYLKRSRSRLTEKKPLRPHDFPVEDKTFGQSPVWYESTIEQWLASRIGRGRRPTED